MTHSRIPRQHEIEIDWRSLRAVDFDRDEASERRVRLICRVVAGACLAGGLCLLMAPLLWILP